MRVPIALHAPHAERPRQLFVGRVRTDVAQDVVVVRVLGGGGRQDVVEEVDVAGGQFERLYLGQFVRRQSGNALPQTGERLVQTLRSLSLPHVGHDPLVLDVLVRLGTLPSRFALAKVAVRVGVGVGVLVVRFDTFAFPAPRLRRRFVLRLHFDVRLAVIEALRPGIGVLVLVVAQLRLIRLLLVVVVVVVVTVLVDGLVGQHGGQILFVRVGEVHQLRGRIVFVFTGTRRRRGITARLEHVRGNDNDDQTLSETD